MSKRLGDGMKYQNENFNGQYDFRCGFHDGWQMPDNLHEYSELLYCKRGEGTVFVNGQPVPLSEKQLIWLPPNYIHRYDCPHAQVVCAVFSNDLIPLFFKAAEGRHYRVLAVDAADLSDVLDGFCQLDKRDYLKISGYLNLIAARAVACSSFEPGKENDGVLYQKVISYISSHYTEDITLTGLSKLFGYNEKYLSHALHELTGIHFRRLLSFYRVNHAKKMLISDEGYSISHIALASGFGAINTFHRVFWETTGMIPSEYRRLNKS